ncbi:MAG: hypothetical protein Gyms2KO_03620 [Gymnodinialimonas sp.]
MEAATDEPVTISRLTALSDELLHLRPEVVPTNELQVEIGEEILTRSGGERIVVPLQVEFLYDHENAFVLGENIAEQIDFSEFTAEQRSIDLRHCDDQWSCEVFASMDAGLISTNTSPVADTSYVFGPALRLSNYYIDGIGAFEIRQVPEIATYTSYNYGYGSCPYLYFIDAQGNMTLYGRVLVGASSAEQTMTESVEIPGWAVGYSIREIEPEISYISRIGIEGQNGNISEMLGQELVLMPRDGVQFELPPGSEILHISGYYTPL